MVKPNKALKKEIKKEVKNEVKKESKMHIFWTKVLSYSVVVILGIGTVFYHFAENWNWLDSLYFSVTTLTTVGYGDLVPTNPVSKFFTIIYILLGIGIIFGFIGIIAKKSRQN